MTLRSWEGVKILELTVCSVQPAVDEPRATVCHADDVRREHALRAVGAGSADRATKLDGLQSQHVQHGLCHDLSRSRTARPL